MPNFPGIAPTDIYLPARSADPGKWAVIACDQFTSQPEYWREVEAYVGSSPSALHIVQPEIDLNAAERRIPSIHAAMREYLTYGTLEKRVENGFSLVERTTASGARVGLVAALDLEAYDYAPGASPLIRATEGTIVERIPPRVRIREGAALESPHTMLLIDDPGDTVIGPLYRSVSRYRKLYDFSLMMGGGRLRGWAVEDEDSFSSVSAALSRLFDVSDGFLYAVGDGNHSLATAKTCWARIKPGLSPKEAARHPARYALAEIVNLHSPALLFEPIHRALFGADADSLIDGFAAHLKATGMEMVPGDEIKFIAAGREVTVSVSGRGGALPLGVLQPYLDAYLRARPEAEIDYIHGEDALRALCREKGAVGILLGAIDKRALFPAIRAGGALPRKTFSMGTAREKRYYMECRKIL